MHGMLHHNARCTSYFLVYIVRVEERGDRSSLTSMETQTSHHGVYKFCVHQVAIKDSRALQLLHAHYQSG
jgi:hypothetical protein